MIRIPTVESYHKALAKIVLLEKRNEELLAALKELRAAAIRNGFESELANVAIAKAEATPNEERK